MSRPRFLCSCRPTLALVDRRGRIPEPNSTPPDHPTGPVDAASCARDRAFAPSEWIDHKKMSLARFIGNPPILIFWIETPRRVFCCFQFKCRLSLVWRSVLSRQHGPLAQSSLLVESVSDDSEVARG